MAHQYLYCDGLQSINKSLLYLTQLTDQFTLFNIHAHCTPNCRKSDCKLRLSEIVYK